MGKFVCDFALAATLKASNESNIKFSDKNSLIGRLIVISKFKMASNPNSVEIKFKAKISFS